MIGDITLWIKKVWKKQTCIHDYKFIPDKVFCKHDYYECQKCNKTRNNLSK